MAASRAPGTVAVPPFIRPTPNQQPFIFAQHDLHYETECGPWFLDITEDLRRLTEESGLAWGQITVFSNHTTAAIRIQENEPLLIEDFKELLRKIAPQERYYRHNDFDIRTVNMGPNEPKNGHSHCQHILLSTSETIPIQAGALQLGPWQSIFLVELDGARQRRVTVTLLGCPGS